MYRYAIWDSDFFLCAIRYEIIRDHFLATDIYYPIRDSVFRRVFVPLCGIIIERITLYRHIRARDVELALH